MFKIKALGTAAAVEELTAASIVELSADEISAVSGGLSDGIEPTSSVFGGELDY